MRKTTLAPGQLFHSVHKEKSNLSTAGCSGAITISCEQFRVCSHEPGTVSYPEASVTVGSFDNVLTRNRYPGFI